MILVLLASSLSLGLQAERSAGISEAGIPLGIVLRSEPDGWRGEALWSSADKDQGAGAPPCCWRTSLSLDREAGPLIVGAGWTHRDAGSWTKDRAWLRGGLHWRWARLILRSALTSRDRESDATASLDIPLAHFTLSPAYGLTLFDQGASTPYRRLAPHVALRLLFSPSPR